MEIKQKICRRILPKFEKCCDNCPAFNDFNNFNYSNNVLNLQINRSPNRQINSFTKKQGFSPKDYIWNLKGLYHKVKKQVKLLEFTTLVVRGSG
jgi:hypothetical protein